MAAKRSRAELADLAAFVDALWKLSPHETKAALARAADYPAPNLSNVINGKTSIDGPNLLRLIRAAAAGRDPVEVAAAAHKIAGAEESLDEGGAGGSPALPATLPDPPTSAEEAAERLGGAAAQLALVEHWVREQVRVQSARRRA